MLTGLEFGCSHSLNLDHPAPKFARGFLCPLLCCPRCSGQELGAAPGALSAPSVSLHPRDTLVAQPRRHPWLFQPRRAQGTRCCLPGARGTSPTTPAAVLQPGGLHQRGRGRRSQADPAPHPGGSRRPGVPGWGRREVQGAVGAAGASGRLREPPGARPPPLGPAPSRVSPAHAAGARPGRSPGGCSGTAPRTQHTGRGPGSPARPSCPN